MNRRTFLKNTALAGAIALSPATAFAESKPDPKSRPNIIVIFTDDQGFADLGCQKLRQDIRTPHIDALARDGIRCTSGYVTAPQCIPSRAALMTGRYQQRFGTDDNGILPPPLSEVMFPKLLSKAGYKTGMVGKWHLEPNHTQTEWLQDKMPEEYKAAAGKPVAIPLEKKLPYSPTRRGFTDMFWGPMQNIWATYDLKGTDYSPGEKQLRFKEYRLDLQTAAAIRFINRHHEEPFFLYLAYFAPHVPLEATQKYLERFPGDMPERRRYALAMMSAFDDGVGNIRETLRKHDLLENTLIFFISDNGAPTKCTMEDIPISFKGGAWDGSLNEPWVGEKGMLSEGGIRVPFIVSWPDKLPKGIDYYEPVISLDVAATALTAAGIDLPDNLDGTDIVPYLSGRKEGSPHQALFWRFWNQAAIRKGKWKYLQAGNAARYLFDLHSSYHEMKNLIHEHPDIADRLREELRKWTEDLRTPGLPEADLNDQEKHWFNFYFNL